MNNIRKLRIDMGITQEELAEMLKIKKSTVSRYESGNITPPATALYSMADCFNVSIDCILGRENPPAPTSIEPPECIGDCVPAFSTILKDLRSEYDYSQLQLANILNVTQQAVGLWEKSKTMPSIPTLLRIAKLFHVSTDYLLNNNEGTCNHLSETANSKSAADIGKRLRLLRESKGYSQSTVADLLGISRPAYVCYETGKCRPVRRLPELAAILSTSVAYILGVEESVPAPSFSSDALEIAKKFDCMNEHSQGAVKAIVEYELNSDIKNNRTPEGTATLN